MSFGQELDQQVIAAAAHRARIVIVIVIVNAEPTPFDDLADLVVREPIGTALPRMVAAPA